MMSLTKGLVIIDASCRSGGHGTKVLTALRENHPDKRIVLNIERIDKQANNNTQRMKRKRFYEKNGHISTGIIVEDGIIVEELGQPFEMLYRGGSITPEETRQV